MARIKFLLPLAFLVLASCATGPSISPPSHNWIQQTEQQAIDNGVLPQTAHAALDRFAPNPRVVELDKKQPETTITFDHYVQNTINDARVRKGAELMREYATDLSAIEQQTGVPPHIIMALWGIESSYGRNMGSFDTINSLATLAYEGRRADFFRGELFAALHIVDQEHLNVSDLRGSWAGAMGQCQFMPSTYLTYAVDGDADGKRDIWNDPVDVMWSIANYLSKLGWRPELNWGQEVALVQPIEPKEFGLQVTHDVAAWARNGVANPDGSDIPDSDVQTSVLQPDAAAEEYYMVTDNFRTIMKWNHSTYFALSVGLLSDDIKKAAGL